MSKQQISNVFNNLEVLQSPLIAIEKYSGVRNGKIPADFYDHCQNIPDPLALDPKQNNLLLLDDCFLGKQNKAEAYYTRGRHNNCNTICIAQNYFRLTRHTIRENSKCNTFLLAVSNSQSNSMVNVFGESVGNESVDLQLVKKSCHNSGSV